MEKYINMVAIPRLHGDFLAQEVVESGIKILDPLCQNKQAFAVHPDFYWDRAHALQCLKDFQQNTKELATDKNGARLDFLHYQEQMPGTYPLQAMPDTLSADELSALKEFMGQEFPKNEFPNNVPEQEKNSENLLETAQIMLILAYHNENLSLELDAVQKKFRMQQANLQSLLDEGQENEPENGQVSTKALTANNALLLPWQQVFSACMAYTQEADAYYVNDEDMAKAIAEISADCHETTWKNGEQNTPYLVHTVAKEQLLPLILPKFRSFCTKKAYVFVIKKQ